MSKITASCDFALCREPAQVVLDIFDTTSKKVLRRHACPEHAGEMFLRAAVPEAHLTKIKTA